MRPTTHALPAPGAARLPAQLGTSVTPRAGARVPPVPKFGKARTLADWPYRNIQAAFERTFRFRPEPGLVTTTGLSALME